MRDVPGDYVVRNPVSFPGGTCLIFLARMVNEAGMRLESKLSWVKC